MSEIYQKLRKLQAERDAIEAALRGERPSERSAESPPAASPTSTPAAASATAATLSMAASLTQMVEQTLAIARFRQELDDRVSSTGVGSIEGVLMLSNQLRSGLDRVLPAEIEQAEAQLDRLRDDFAHLGDELQRLKMLKLELSAER
jgi:hypothetical protein